MVVFKLRTSLSVRKYNNRFNLGKTTFNLGHMADIDETAETGVSVRARQQSFTQAAPNELKLGEGGKVTRAGHRRGGGIGG